MSTAAGSSNISAVSPAAIAAAVAALGRGEIVAYPTETSYGLAVDAGDAAALARPWWPGWSPRSRALRRN